MTSPRSVLAAACAGLVSLVLVGCSVGDDPTAAPSTDVDATTTTPAAPSPTTPAATASDAPALWTNRDDATAALVAFVAELEAAEHYRVDRDEAMTIAGETLATRQQHLVDLAAQRVGSIQVFEVSDPAVVEELIGDSEMSIEDLETHIVFDYIDGPPRMLMTYPTQWDGRWLELNPEDLAAEDEMLGSVLGASRAGDHAVAFLDVAALDVSGWFPSSGALEIDVPSYLATDWIPNRTAMVAAQAGVDLETVTAAVTAEVRGVAGGIEMKVDISPLLESLAATLSDQPDVAAFLRQTEASVTVTIHDLGTAERVELPPEDAISDEPWQ